MNFSFSVGKGIGPLTTAPVAFIERLRVRVDALDANADAGGDLDEAVDGLAEIAELAKQIEAEVQRARQAADAGA